MIFIYDVYLLLLNELHGYRSIRNLKYRRNNFYVLEKTKFINTKQFSFYVKKLFYF